MAIEDLFICPSRDTREENPQPDGEYGAAVRMYNPKRRCYDMTYICSKGTTRLEARKEGGVVACTVLEDPSNQWRFVKVTEDTFHWQNVTKQAEGLQVNCEVFARRIDVYKRQMQETVKDDCTRFAVSGKQPIPVYQEFDKAA